MSGFAKGTGRARTLLARGGVLLSICTLLGSTSLQAQEPIRATIDVTRTAEPIDPLLYGHFIENLGNESEGYFEGGYWAELLGDRKFFYPVDNEPLDPPNSRSGYVNRWWVDGPEDAVVMDSVHAYAGEHSPRVLLDGASAPLIHQEVGVREGTSYSGRIVLAGDASAEVQVSLVWGPDPGDRETVTISPLWPDYQKYPLSFTAAADNPEARFEITGAGSGSFLVGAVSLMPADNVEGWDRAVLDLLEQTNPTMLRWGGNFSSNYDWRDGIGDMDRRRPQYDFAWDSLEPNDVGTFEVMTLNRIFGSVPKIGTNAGLGDAHSAARWVEYVNGSLATPMGRLRAEHGHAEPFDVKVWGIGNEMYGQWQIGHMSIDHYVIKHNEFGRRMLEVDPTLELVASGASLYQMHANSRTAERLVDPPYERGSSMDWSGNLLEHTHEYTDHIGEHIYGSTTHYFNEEGGEWVAEPEAPPEVRLRRVANRIKGVAEEMEEYRRRMPWVEEKDIRIAMTEWSGGGGQTLRGLWASMVLNEMFRHPGVFSMSHHTSLRRLFEHDRYHDPVFTMSGLVFKLYTTHFGTVPILDIEGDSPQPVLNGAVGVDRPQESSGSPTYPLDVMAALAEDGGRLTVVVVNPSEAEQTLELDARGAALAGGGRMWTIAAPTLDAENRPGQPQTTELVESELADPGIAHAVAPLSVNLYELEIQ